MLLLYPPAVRSTEYPLGVSRISGFLNAHGIKNQVIDLNNESLSFINALQVDPITNGEKNAYKRRSKNIIALQTKKTYNNFDTYSRSVYELSTSFRIASSLNNVTVGLADYHDTTLSPLKKQDLIESAVHYEKNIYFPFFSERLDMVLSDTKISVVGISINFLSQALCAFALAGMIRKKFPEKKIFLGGGLISSWILQGRINKNEKFNGFIDYAYAFQGEIIFADYFNIKKITEISTPNFLQFNENKYLSPKKIIPYNFSFGCPWQKCIFCPENAEKSIYTGVKKQNGISIIEKILKTDNPEMFHFTDNELSPLYLNMMIELNYKIPWYGFARFSDCFLDEKFCFLLASSGCVMLQLGLESGSQNVLNAIGKGTTLLSIKKILSNLKSAGISTYIYIMFGMPSENYKKACMTRDFILENNSCIDFLNVAIFNMPLSGVEAKIYGEKFFYEGDLSLYADFIHPEKWDRKSIRKFISSDFESIKEIKEIVKRNPPIFTSNHAPFFL